MITPKIKWLMRIMLLTIIGLAGAYSLLTSILWVRAEANDQIMQQGTPGYDGPATNTPGAGNNNGYPNPPTSTTQPSSATKTPTSITRTPSGTKTPTGTPGNTLTPTSTPTLPPNVFKTEDSEINGAQGTPPVTDTPGSSPTPVLSTTITQTQVIPTKVLVKKTDLSNRVDWGTFWIGFSVPVLAACGMVLYYLDRRPDFFKPKK